MTRPRLLLCGSICFALVMATGGQGAVAESTTAPEPSATETPVPPTTTPSTAPLAPLPPTQEEPVHGGHAWAVYLALSTDLYGPESTTLSPSWRTWVTSRVGAAATLPATREGPRRSGSTLRTATPWWVPTSIPPWTRHDSWWRSTHVDTRCSVSAWCGPTVSTGPTPRSADGVGGFPVLRPAKVDVTGPPASPLFWATTVASLSQAGNLTNCCLRC